MWITWPLKVQNSCNFFRAGQVFVTFLGVVIFATFLVQRRVPGVILTSPPAVMAQLQRLLFERSFFRDRSGRIVSWTKVAQRKHLEMVKMKIWRIYHTSNIQVHVVVCALAIFGSFSFNVEFTCITWAVTTHHLFQKMKHCAVCVFFFFFLHWPDLVSFRTKTCKRNTIDMWHAAVRASSCCSLMLYFVASDKDKNCRHQTCANLKRNIAKHGIRATNDLLDIPVQVYRRSIGNARTAFYWFRWQTRWSLDQVFSLELSKAFEMHLESRVVSSASHYINFQQTSIWGLKSIKGAALWASPWGCSAALTMSQWSGCPLKSRQQKLGEINWNYFRATFQANVSEHSILLSVSSSAAEAEQVK